MFDDCLNSLIAKGTPKAVNLEYFKMLLRQNGGVQYHREKQ